MNLSNIFIFKKSNYKVEKMTLYFCLAIILNLCVHTGSLTVKPYSNSLNNNHSNVVSMETPAKSETMVERPWQTNIS